MAMQRKRGLDALMGFGSPEEAMPPGAAGPEESIGLMGDPTMPMGAESQLPVDTAGAGIPNEGLEGFAPPEGDALMMDEEDPQLAEMEAAYTDPNTPPELRQLLEMELAMAARRGLAGV